MYFVCLFIYVPVHFDDIKYTIIKKATTKDG